MWRPRRGWLLVLRSAQPLTKSASSRYGQVKRDGGRCCRAGGGPGAKRRAPAREISATAELPARAPRNAAWAGRHDCARPGATRPEAQGYRAFGRGDRAQPGRDHNGRSCHRPRPGGRPQRRPADRLWHSRGGRGVPGIGHRQVSGGTINRMTALAPVPRPDRQRLREGRLIARSGCKEPPGASLFSAAK